MPQKKSSPRLTFSFLSQMMPVVVAAVASLPPDPSGGMAAVLISSPGPRLCRSIWLASVSSTSSNNKKKKGAIGRSDFFRRPALSPSSGRPFCSTSGSFLPVLCVVADGGLVWSPLSQPPPLQPAEALCSAASHLTAAEEKEVALG